MYLTMDTVGLMYVLENGYSGHKLCTCRRNVRT